MFGLFLFHRPCIYCAFLIFGLLISSCSFDLAPAWSPLNKVTTRCWFDGVRVSTFFNSKPTLAAYSQNVTESKGDCAEAHHIVTDPVQRVQTVESLWIVSTDGWRRCPAKYQLLSRFLLRYAGFRSLKEQQIRDYDIDSRTLIRVCLDAGSAPTVRFVTSHFWWRKSTCDTNSSNHLVCLSLFMALLRGLRCRPSPGATDRVATHQT